MTPKHKKLTLMFQIFNGGGNIEDLMKGIGNAIKKHVRGSRRNEGNPMEDILNT